MTRGVRLPSLMLSGPAELDYLRDLAAMLRLARLNTQYIDPARLDGYLVGLSPEVHGHLYPGLELDCRSGLPTFREWSRLYGDWQVAASALAEMPPAAELEARAQARPGSIYGRRLLKQRYYQAIHARPLQPLDQISVALRRIDAKAGTAQVCVALDKLDATGALVRVTVELTEVSSFWRRKLVAVEEDLAAHTEELKALVYQNAGTEAELLFAQLATRKGVSVQRVSRGTIGPVVLAGIRAPPALAELVATQGMVATFALDTAAVEMEKDVDNDPLLDPMAASLSAEAQAGYLEARARLGYKVAKERKFVVHEPLAEAVRAYCRASRTRNPVYVLRNAPTESS